MIVWQSSSRVTNSSAERSQTARPSRLANTFFSRSWKREDCPAAGRITAKRDMGTPRRPAKARRPAIGPRASPSYRAAYPVRQFSLDFAEAVEVGVQLFGFGLQMGVDRGRVGLGPVETALQARQALVEPL